MARSHRTSPHSILSFWWSVLAEAYNKSDEKFGRVINLSALLAAGTLLVFAFLSHRNPKLNTGQEDNIVSYWLVVIPAGLWLLWFLFHLAKAPV